MTKKYRWGILSTANIGKKAMIPALQASNMAEVVAVASRDLHRAQRFADDLNILEAFGDYQALIDSPGIDAVYIPLPNHLHKTWSIRAAEAGKHILCEKPLALNADECREMIAAAKANGVELMESFMYRFHPRIMAACEMIRAGEIGPLKTVDTAFTFHLADPDDIRLKPEMGGGALMDVGCYCVNLCRLMAGRLPKMVQARAVWTSSGVDDQLVGLLDFGDDLFAHFDCAFNQEERQHAILAGADGYLEIPFTFNPGEESVSIERVKGMDVISKRTFAGVDVYRLIAEAFMLSIESGKPPYPVEDAVENMRVIEALLESARQDGTPVKL